MARCRIRLSVACACFAVSACQGGSDSKLPVSGTAAPTSVDDATTDREEPEAPTTTTAGVPDGPLGAVCADTLVVQTSDFPDVGAGPLYALLGESPEVDAVAQTASAALTRADGTEEDVSLEIRSGGPAVGFRSPIDVMVRDDSVQLALASTADVVRGRSALPTQAVMSLTDRSHDALIIDPSTYPDVEDLESLGDRSIEVRHVTDAPVIRFLEATGVLAPEQLIPGSDGLPATFVGESGAVVQQGDLSIEPVLLPALPQWARPVRALPASAAGWASLDDMVVVDSSTQRLSDECLGRLVRVLQQSIVAYVADPTATNAVMSAIRGEFNPLARLTPELFDDGAQLAFDAGVFDSSDDRPAGAIDIDDWDGFLETMALSLGVEPVTSQELVDTRFIDPTISR